jgi:hypothetical protein
VTVMTTRNQQESLTGYALRKCREQGLTDEAFWQEAAQRASSRLAGGSPGKIPLPVEVAALINDAEAVCIEAAYKRPVVHCGAVPPGRVAGRLVRCDLGTGHTSRIKHRNRETGFAWWGEK